MILSGILKPQQKDASHTSMGTYLKAIAEDQLTKDLARYQIRDPDLHFDWSQSYGCGHEDRFMDGTLQNFSRIVVFDSRHELVADGCMDFISNKYFCLCYWDLVTTWRKGKIVSEKKESGMPFHIWKQLPVGLMTRYAAKLSHS